ncbi:CpsD/CapB family tyrosine-protein kinase [Clostridium sp. DSM 100503]|uniref:CpsD/CapB family tyrosine-protein kinase n=1 Tax=Clostridium sp. DSM 100503 TaxID=2963282 RepID=UPI002149D2C2|nr:CpsD/CapB family tyrosine-protein kinase [Clostridium sp. DSM 100503]MCR1951314.1 CpsD/CapB family tyrosine-protein kinase [Clostridium sp. DSM 100503]
MLKAKNKKSKKNKINDEHKIDMQIGEEAFKVLRNNLQYSLVSYDSAKIIVVTSPEKGDGKSTVSANLAKSLALAGKNVIIIDADLRRPSLHRKLGTINGIGLVDIIVGENRLIDALIDIEKKLYAITSGKSTTNPAELLMSKRVANIIGELKQKFDYIIIDTPPINLVSDALPLLSLSNGVILVAKYRKTKKKELLKAAKTIKNTSNNLLGVVLNSVEVEEKGYYTYY